MSTALKIEKAVRVFRFNNMPLQDPDPKQTPEEVKEFYARIHPELTNAEIEGPNAKGAEIVYEFRKAVGTKGNEDPPRPLPLPVDAGISLIAKERQRQITGEGFDVSHDDEHTDHEMAFAAVAYAAPEQLFRVKHYGDGAIVFNDVWPSHWDANWDKRARHGEFNEEGLLDADEYPIDIRIKNLVKAGALIAAEIARLLRKKNNG